MEEELLARIKGLEETIELLSFQQELLFSNTDVDRMLFEYKITRKQYDLIMDLMDIYRNKIGENEEVDHNTFEQEMYEIVPNLKGDYHFVELLTRSFWEIGRWEEVFEILYKVLPKYKHINKGI